jgi:hypothetical protein
MPESPLILVTDDGLHSRLGSILWAPVAVKPATCSFAGCLG